MGSASAPPSSASRPPGARRPRPLRPQATPSSRPAGAEGGSEPRTRAGPGRASTALAPEPRTEGGRASAEGGSRPAPAQPECGPLASRPAEAGAPRLPRAYPPPDLPGAEERRAGTGRGAAGRSLPLHHAGLDLDLPHARIGHGPWSAAGRRGRDCAARRRRRGGGGGWAWRRGCARAHPGARPSHASLPEPTIPDNL